MDWNQTKPPLGAKLNHSHPLSKGIVGCWLFNEGMGDKVYDLSGNDNTGTLTGISHPATATSGWIPGKFGKVVKFPLTASSCGIEKNIMFKYVTIISGARCNYLYGGAWLFDRIGPGGTDVIALTLKGTGYADGIAFYSNGWKASGINGRFDDGKYYNFAGTYDGKSLIFYVDGKVNSANEVNLGILPQRLGVSTIGSRGVVPLPYGEISYTYLYDRALSNKEINYLHTSPFCFIN